MGARTEDGYDVMSVPLGGGEETKLFLKNNRQEFPGMMTVDGDYLYLSNAEDYIGYNQKIVYEDGKQEEYNPKPCGRRWNLKKGEMEVLSAEIDVVMTEENKIGFRDYISASEPIIKWKKDNASVYR